MSSKVAGDIWGIWKYVAVFIPIILQKPCY